MSIPFIIKSKKFLILILTVFFLTGCLIYTFREKFKQSFDEKYRIEINGNDQEGWAYSIFYQDTLLIKQEYVPAIEGGKKFKTKEDAKKTGELVIDKLKNKKNPSIVKEDLNKNNIKFKEHTLH